MKADLPKIKTDWALEKAWMESEVAKAEWEVAKAVEKYRTFVSFAVEKAQVVANFQKSEEFYSLYQDFGHVSYEEGFNTGSLSVGQLSWITFKE